MAWKDSIQYHGKRLGHKTSQTSVTGLVSQFVSFTAFGNVLAFSTMNIRLTPHKLDLALYLSRIQLRSLWANRKK